MIKYITESTEYLQSKGFDKPEIGIILGTGLGQLINEVEIIAKNIIHDNNPCLNWCLSNITIQEDPAGNIKPNKSKSVDRIDPIVALIMALGGYYSEDDGTSVYDERDLLVL